MIKLIHYILFLSILLVFLPFTLIEAKEKELPLRTQIVLYKAQGLIEKKEYDKAIDLLIRFQEKGKGLREEDRISKGYDNYMIDFTIGNCYLLKKDYTDAVSFYRRSLKKKPSFYLAWVNLSRCYYELKRYKEAGDSFVRCYEIDPKKDPQYLYYGGICYLTDGRHKEAIRVLERLLEVTKGADLKTEWKEAISQAYLLGNYPRKALPFVEELSVETKGIRRKQWQEQRLHLYLTLEMEEKAFNYLNELIREDPLEPKWWKGLSHFYLKKNNYKGALVALTIKGLLEPLTEQEQRIAADLYISVDIPYEAVRLYKKMARKHLTPKMAYRIAQCYIRLHRPKDALLYIEKAIEAKKDKDISLLMLKGELLYELERYRNAADTFEDVAKISLKKGNEKTAAKALLMEGYSAWNAKDLNRAIEAFRMAAKFPSQRSSALKALERIRKADMIAMKDSEIKN